MARRKRPYVPKIKGCYQCSQRRINCDRQEPVCGKCAASNIKCGGLSPKRIRFVEDVAAEKDALSRRNRLCGSRNSGGESSQQNSLALRARAAHSSSPQLGLDVLDGESQFLLTYFSNTIAPEMTVMDDSNNGWRYLVLPIARTDDMVRAAVTAAAAFHFHSSTDTRLVDPMASYYNAIALLRKRQDLAGESVVGQQSVLLGLLVMLASTMIQGSSDFRVLFNLIETAFSAVGGEDAVAQGELGTFLVRQVRKYRGYASPMVSQAQGIKVLSQTTLSGPSTSRGWDDFTNYYQRYSALDRSLAIMYDLNTLACHMYVARAQRGWGVGASLKHVEDVKKSLESLPPNCPCEHALIWPTFIAALECSTQEHKDFFKATLEKHYQRNKFANLLRALEYLELRWSGHSDLDWTRTLPDLPAFVV